MNLMLHLAIRKFYMLMPDDVSLIFDTVNPSYLLVSESPISLDGKPKKLPVDEAEKLFDFKYCENVLISKELSKQQSFSPKTREETDLLERLKNPLNDKLVICFINKDVGYGVFANSFIEAGTIIGVYAGQIEKKSNVDKTYGWALDNNLRVNARKYGGITRFIQHMPYSNGIVSQAIRGKSSNINAFFKILEGNSIYFDEKDMQTVINLFKKDQLNFKKAVVEHNIESLMVRNHDIKLSEEMSNKNYLNMISNLATANIKSTAICINGQKIIYLISCVDILPGEQLGVSYGMEYWNSKGTSPLYFYKDSKILSKEVEDLHKCTDKFFTGTNNIQWKFYPPEKLQGKYLGHQLTFFTMAPDQKMLAEKFCNSLKENGFDSKMKSANDKPSIVVDLTSSAP